MTTQEKAQEELDKAMSAISVAPKMYDDAGMMLEVDSGWDRYLIPAPYAIALLGQLMIVANATDFTLERKPDALLKYDSFRASLAQVSHGGWGAFNLAHANMDKINLTVANIPVYLKNAVKLLVEGSQEDVRDFLSLELNNVRESAQSCLQLALATRKEFHDVIFVIQELIEACTSARGQYEENLKANQAAKAVADAKRKGLEEEQKMTTEQLEELKKVVKSAQSDYRSAMDSIPSGWEMAAMNVIDSVSSCVSAMTNSISLGWLKIPNLSWGDQQAEPVANNNAPDHGGEICVQKGSMPYTKANFILTIANQMIAGLTNEGRVDEISTRNLDAQAIRMITEQLSRTEKEVNKMKKGKPRTEVAQICKNGMDLSKKLLTRSASMNGQDDPVLVDEIYEFLSKAEELNAKACVALESAPVRKAGPGISQAKKGSNMGETALYSAQSKADNAREMLEHQQRRMEQHTNKMSQLSKAYAEGKYLGDKIS